MIHCGYTSHTRLYIPRRREFHPQGSDHGVREMWSRAHEVRRQAWEPAGEERHLPGPVHACCPSLLLSQSTYGCQEGGGGIPGNPHDDQVTAD